MQSHAASLLGSYIHIDLLAAMRHDYYAGERCTCSLITGLPELFNVHVYTKFANNIIAYHRSGFDCEILMIANC